MPLEKTYHNERMSTTVVTNLSDGVRSKATKLVKYFCNKEDHFEILQMLGLTVLLKIKNFELEDDTTSLTLPTSTVFLGAHYLNGCVTFDYMYDLDDDNTKSFTFKLLRSEGTLELDPDEVGSWICIAGVITLNRTTRWYVFLRQDSI